MSHIRTLTGDELVEIRNITVEGGPAAITETCTTQDIADLSRGRFYDLVQFYPGKPTDAALLSYMTMVRPITFTQNFPGSYATATVAATNSTVLAVKKNGVLVGAITYANGQTTGVYSSSSDIAFATGDVLAIYNQNTADLTLANINVSMTGTVTA